MKGIVKSTPLSRSAVIVKSVIARSTCCNWKFNYRLMLFKVKSITLYGDGVFTGSNAVTETVK